MRYLLYWMKQLFTANDDGNKAEEYQLTCKEGKDLNKGKNLHRREERTFIRDLIAYKDHQRHVKASFCVSCFPHTHCCCSSIRFLPCNTIFFLHLVFCYTKPSTVSWTRRCKIKRLNLSCSRYLQPIFNLLYKKVQRKLLYPSLLPLFVSSL